MKFIEQPGYVYEISYQLLDIIYYKDIKKVKINMIIKEDNYLVEMTVINPKLCKQLTIQVEVEQRDEGPIPHLHVYHDHTRNPKKCSYIRLDKCDYSEHHTDNIPLPKTLKKQFLEVMNSNYKGRVMYDYDGNIYPVTGYQAAVMVWAETFENDNLDKFNLDENGLIIQLDYSNL